MPNAITTIEPMGVRPQFKTVKAYLKCYTRGFDEEEYQRKLDNLQRYASEGEGFVYGRGGMTGSPLIFNFSSAYVALVGVYWVTRWFAIQAALSGAADWYLQWQRSVAYGYWAYRMTQLERGPTSLKKTVSIAANCLVLGWEDWAIDLAGWVNRGIENKKRFWEYDKAIHPRTQIFILRLIADWQQWPTRDWEKWVFDEPIFNALLEHWRTPDANALRPLLIAACDRHTHESRFDISTKHYDINTDAFWYDPFEVLAVLKLRELRGLANPALDHTLMNTPLGKLPAPAARYSDALLDGVIDRVRVTQPEF